MYSTAAVMQALLEDSSTDAASGPLPSHGAYAQPSWCWTVTHPPSHPAPLPCRRPLPFEPLSYLTTSRLYSADSPFSGTRLPGRASKWPVICKGVHTMHDAGGSGVGR